MITAAEVPSVEGLRSHGERELNLPSDISRRLGLSEKFFSRKFVITLIV